MELRQLRYFVAVAEEGNFTRAASRVNLTQPNLSKQIQKLEEELGAELFVRTARGADLTRAGEVLLEQARALLSSGERARRAVQSLGAVAAPLRVGMPDWPRAVRFARRVTEAFAGVHPEFNLRLSATPWMEHHRALREEHLDVAFTNYPDTAPFDHGLTGTRLFQDPGCYALLPETHPLAARDVLSAGDLDFLPLWTVSRHALPPLYDLAVQALQTAGITPGPLVETGSVAGIGTSFGFGDGWAIVTTSVGQEPPPGCVARRVQNLHAPSSFCLMWRAGDSTPGVQTFVALAERAAGELKAAGMA